MKINNGIAGLVALVLILLAVALVLKVILESLGIVIILIILWYIYTHMLQKRRGRQCS